MNIESLMLLFLSLSILATTVLNIVSHWTLNEDIAMLEGELDCLRSEIEDLKMLKTT